jgi:hypothetical protein
LGSGGSAKKLILIFMSQPYGAPNRGRVKTRKIKTRSRPGASQPTGEAASFKLLSPRKRLSQVRQPKAAIKRPIQHRAALLLDTLTSLLHFTVSEWWKRIKLIPSH